MRDSKKTKGFTLIELMIYIAIFSVLIVVLSELFSAILNVKKESEANTAVQQDVSYLMTRFMYDISRASSVTVPSTLGETGSSLQIVIDGINYSYALSGGQLTLTNNNGTDSLSSSETTVSNLSFTRLGSGSTKDSIRFSFTVTSNVVQSSGQESKTVLTTVGLR